MNHPAARCATAPLLLCTTLLLPGCETGGSEVEVHPADLPPAVLTAVRTAHPDGVIEEAEVETEDGVSFYEVELVDGDREVELKLAADGTLLEIQEEDD